MDQHDEMALCHRRIAEAHTAMAQLLEGISQSAPEPAAVQIAAVQPPEMFKYKARNGYCITPKEWRFILHENENALIKVFGTNFFMPDSLRSVVQDFASLSSGDLELLRNGKTHKPRWHANLQHSIDCISHVWPTGRAVVVRTEIRGRYRLTGADQ